MSEQCTSVKLQCVVHGAKITFCQRCQMLLEIIYTNLFHPSVKIITLPILSFLKQNNISLGGIAAQEGRGGSPVKERIQCLAKNFPLQVCVMSRTWRMGLLSNTRLVV